MTRDVNDVVHSARDRVLSILISVRSVASSVDIVENIEVNVSESLVIAVNSSGDTRPGLCDAQGAVN